MPKIYSEMRKNCKNCIKKNHEKLKNPHTQIPNKLYPKKGANFTIEG